jgi:hypothetical protein
MIARMLALFEALTAADLDQARLVDLERFAALCRHWAALADLARSGPKAGVLGDLKNGDRSE